MALKKCKDCGEKVGKKAKSCPICGAPIKNAKEKTGCLTYIIIFSVGLWVINMITTPKYVNMKSTAKNITATVQKNDSGLTQTDIDKISKDIVVDYKGKIISVEKLDASTCWIRLNPKLNDMEALKSCENIGHYIKRASNGKLTPVVHVFFGGTHIAKAYPNGGSYSATLDIKKWQ